jgi:hypothetical protein
MDTGWGFLPDQIKQHYSETGAISTARKLLRTRADDRAKANVQIYLIHGSDQYIEEIRLAEVYYNNNLRTTKLNRILSVEESNKILAAERKTGRSGFNLNWGPAG